MVQIHPGPPHVFFEVSTGGVAQLGERLPCTQEAIGSIPFTSTNSLSLLGSVSRDSLAEEVFFDNLEIEIHKLIECVKV